MNFGSKQREALFREFAQYQKQQQVIIAYRDTADGHWSGKPARRNPTFSVFTWSA